MTPASIAISRFAARPLAEGRLVARRLCGVVLVGVACLALACGRGGAFRQNPSPAAAASPAHALDSTQYAPPTSGGVHTTETVLPGRDGAPDTLVLPGFDESRPPAAQPSPASQGTGTPADYRERPAPSDSLLLDALGQVYLWSPNQALRKLAPATEILDGTAPQLRYRNQRLGRIAQVDLTNAMRPVLYYAEAQTVVWLDRNLAELRQLPLVDLDLGRIDAVAYAPNDALWVYSPDRQQLLQIDRQGTVQQRSFNFAQTFGQPVRVSAISASPQQVALLSTDGRVLVFGPFGAFRTQILRPATQLLTHENALFFVEDGQWWYNDPGGVGVERIAVPADGRRLVMVRGERALWRRGDRVWVE